MRESDVFVHPLALCESQEVGNGSRIWPFAHVMVGAIVGEECNIGGHTFIETGARIGDRVTIKNGVMVFRGSVVEDDVFIGPGVIFTNDRHPRSPRMEAVRNRYQEQGKWLSPIHVCRGATIGAGAILIAGVTVGAFACVGASAVVTRDVTDHAIVVGAPARAAGWACVCGRPLSSTHECPDCGRCFRFAKNQLELRESVAWTNSTE